jgi:hypothetical protein
MSGIFSAEMESCEINSGWPKWPIFTICFFQRFVLELFCSELFLKKILPDLTKMTGWAMP